MALGKPGVVVPNALELRPIAAAILTIRQRIEQIEQSIAATASAASTSVVTQGDLAVLRKSLADLAGRVLLLETAGKTDIATFTAGEDIAVGAPVLPLTDTTVGVADASDPLRMFGVIGLAVNAATAGSAVNVQRRGVFAVSGAAFELHRAVYVGDGTNLTQTPDYEATAAPIGVAVSATHVFINPDFPTLLGPVFDSSVGDAYLKYLPVSYSMLGDLMRLPAGLPSFGSGSVPFDALLTVEYAGEQFQLSIGDLASAIWGGG